MEWLPAVSPVVRKLCVIGRAALFALFALIVLSGSPGHAAAPDVKKTEQPAWVQNVPVNLDATKKPSEVEGGSYRLLVDRQFNVPEAAEFGHYANRLLTEAAVESGSRVSVTFDPSYQELTFHKLVVYRNGQATDRLPTQAFKLLQREKGLDRNLYDGRLSAEVILEDIRVGDILEYAFSVRGENPLFAGRCDESFRTDLNVPIEHLRIRVSCPTARPLKVKSFGRPLAPAITTLGELTEYLWEARNIPAVISDGEVPSWFDPWSWAQATEFTSWADVAQWESGIYVVPADIPEELQKEVSRIEKLEPAEARALAALRYVQDNIRYLGIEVGVNTHKPYPLETILARRFGDCKDKALMLCAMLRHLGFEADPALVNTDERQSVADRLPTAGAFDHLVVRLRYQGKDIWLDPTDRDQGGALEKIYFPAYGFALIISPKTTDLIPIRPGGYADSSREIRETIDIKDFKGGATLRVRSISRGHEADSMRANFADSSVESTLKTTLNFYGQAFPEIKALANPVVQDDRATNVFTKEDSYEITNLWKPPEDKKDHEIHAAFTSIYLRRLDLWPDTVVRSMPFEVDHPRKIVHVIEINFPRKLRFDPEHVVVTNPAFSFEYTTTSTDLKLTLSYSYESRMDHVPAAAMGKYLEDLKRLRRSIGYEFSVPEAWTKYDAKTWGLETNSNLGEEELEEKSPLNPAQAVGITLAIVFVGGALGVWRMTRSPSEREAETPTLHRCVVCGETERTNAKLEFRVAANGDDYCTRHLPGS